jgi:hypothetical protein
MPWSNDQHADANSGGYVPLLEPALDMFGARFVPGKPLDRSPPAASSVTLDRRKVGEDLPFSRRGAQVPRVLAGVGGPATQLGGAGATEGEPRVMPHAFSGARGRA